MMVDVRMVCVGIQNPCGSDQRLIVMKDWYSKRLDIFLARSMNWRLHVGGAVSDQLSVTSRDPGYCRYRPVNRPLESVRRTLLDPLENGCLNTGGVVTMWSFS